MSFHVVATGSISEEAMVGIRVTSRHRAPFRRWPKGDLHAAENGAEVTVCGVPIAELFEFRERSWPPRGVSPDSAVCVRCSAALRFR